MLPRVMRETKGQKVICTFQIDLFIAFFALLVNLFICFGCMYVSVPPLLSLFVFSIACWQVVVLSLSLIVMLHSITEKGVPNFWLMAMKTNEIFAEDVNDWIPSFIWVLFSMLNM